MIYKFVFLQEKSRFFQKIVGFFQKKGEIFAGYEKN